MGNKVRIFLKKAKSESSRVYFFMKNVVKSEERPWEEAFLQRLSEKLAKVRVERPIAY